MQVLLSLDRYLSIKVKSWTRTLFNSERAAIASAILVAALFLQNLNVVFTFGQYASHNGTEIFVCYALDEAGNWMNIWSTVRNIYVKINFNNSEFFYFIRCSPLCIR